MKEQWLAIPGYEGFYEVSNLGRVRSMDRAVGHPINGKISLKGKVLIQSLSSDGLYFVVSLCKEGQQKTYAVHKLVASTWLGPRPTGTEICHGPAGQKNNAVSNLRYGTRSENQLDCRRDNTRGRVVIREDGRRFGNAAIAAESIGHTRQSVARVCRGEQKTAGGFSWRYA